MSYSRIDSYPNVNISYKGLAGVDLSSDERDILPFRASRCINMYKKYSEKSGSFLHTRPGFEKALDLGEEIFGVHFFEGGAYIHSGSSLYLTDTALTGTALCFSQMEKGRSVSFEMNGKLYILDGKNYLCCQNGSVSRVEGYIPVTRIGASAAGGGSPYQSVNLLSPYRKNTFCADGQSTVYYLDATEIEGIEKVWVNGEEVTDYTLNAPNGTVTFTVAPALSPIGEDNVEITYKKETEGAYEKISGCTLACLFDNRVFFSGNISCKGVVFHSEIKTPEYIADINYYEDGDEGIGVCALAVKDNTLTVIKERGVNAVYCHTPVLNYELGRVYPAYAQAISVGGALKGGAAVARDNLVYISPYGLEGLVIYNGAGSLMHCSSLVDSALLREDLKAASLCLWNGYLCILTNGRMYLADLRTLSGGEYEWYIWEELYSNTPANAACLVFERENTLYFGTKNGSICRFTTAYKDEGRAIESLWESKSEAAGFPTIKKSVIKSGCALLLKKISNSKIEVFSAKDGEKEKSICMVNMGGFDFENMDFASLSFSTGEDNLVPVPLNEKAFLTLRLIIRSNSVFGLGGAHYIARLHNHKKTYGGA